MQAAWVWSLVRELRSYMQHNVGKEKKRTDSHCSLTCACFSVREATEKEPRPRSSWGALHAPAWATLRPPTCAAPSPLRPGGTAGRAPSAGPPSSGCSGAGTPGWGSGVAAPGSTARRRACPTCSRNSSSFWPLGDRGPALSWSHRVSPGRWASRWWWGLGAHGRDRNRSLCRTHPCSHLQGKPQGVSVSKRPQTRAYLCGPLFSYWIAHSIRVSTAPISGHSLLYIHQ